MSEKLRAVMILIFILNATYIYVYYSFDTDSIPVTDEIADTTSISAISALR